MRPSHLDLLVTGEQEQGRPGLIASQGSGLCGVPCGTFKRLCRPQAGYANQAQSRASPSSRGRMW